MPNPLTVYPVKAPIRDARFDLVETAVQSLARAKLTAQVGDVLAISSKYAAIAEGRVFDLDAIQPSARAHELAQRYRMSAAVAQLVLQEAEHVFGGIELGFLLTAKAGIIAPNAGLDRSNIPSGKVVLLPEHPYKTAFAIFDDLRKRLDRHIGVILTDSWLVPGRYGATGIALASAGFQPIKDERGKMDLFGNPMAVTQVGVADALAVAAQVVMGERDEATPFALARGAEISLSDEPNSPAEVAIPWLDCIYVKSLTRGLLPDGAAQQLESGASRNSPKSR